jgi:hypothetical protein
MTWSPLVDERAEIAKSAKVKHGPDSRKTPLPLLPEPIRCQPFPIYRCLRLQPVGQATALSLIAWIFVNSRVTFSSSNSFSGPVGAKSVNGGA